ncbi:hypothetical protein [Vibrio toranzoniae]|uniref:hypothetical protein n=1 Tax=Vibrio toranzoniae TaxID=1194427 RepID=UPI0013782CD7|nr:hypothetical protein [Vibrio toranzoniae]NAZ92712.1 hypothetical protein [Vibrio toranzoniae]NAZ98690.1 hypothetical protein [Vibrio toranzoniae]
MENIDFVWTIVVGVITGLLANFLTPTVSLGASKLSLSYKKKRGKQQEKFENSVQHLLNHPLDEVNLRIEKNGRFIRSWILLVGAGTLAILGKDTKIAFFSVVLLFVSLVFLKQASKLNKLLGAVWERRRKEYGNIDLG